MVDRTISYSVLDGDGIERIIVTNSRDHAIQLMEQGYTLFTVPQMFNKEDGEITLYLDTQGQNPSPNRMTKESASRVLADYETSSRKLYTD